MPKMTSLEIPGLDSLGSIPPFGSNDVLSVLTTSFLAFSGLKMPKTTSLEISGLDSP